MKKARWWWLLGGVALGCVLTLFVRWVFTGDSGNVQAVTNLAQIISVIALPLALYGLYSAKRDLVSERRLAHELDILRELAGFMPLTIARTGETDELGTAAKLRSLVRAIPGSSDLPLTRAALQANPTDQALADFERLCPDPPDPDTAEGRFQRFSALGLAAPQAFRSEVHAAIEARVNR